MYFIEHNLNDFLRDTVPHEVAHLYEWTIYRSIGHKKHWKEFMQMMGVLDPKRCHYYLKGKNDNLEYSLCSGNICGWLEC